MIILLPIKSGFVFLLNLEIIERVFFYRARRAAIANKHLSEERGGPSGAVTTPQLFLGLVRSSSGYSKNQEHWWLDAFGVDARQCQSLGLGVERDAHDLSLQPRQLGDRVSHVSPQGCQLVRELGVNEPLERGSSAPGCGREAQSRQELDTVM